MLWCCLAKVCAHFKRIRIYVGNTNRLRLGDTATRHSIESSIALGKARPLLGAIDITQTNVDYHLTSNIRHTLVGNIESLLTQM